MRPVSVLSLSVVSAPDRRRGPRALFALMADQHGVASRRQARGLGVSRAVEDRLVAEGALVRLTRGVVAAGGAPLTFSAQAMAATLRPGVTAISHGAAARLHGITGFAHHPVIDVIGPRGSHLRVETPMFARYSRGPIADHVVMVGPIAVLSLPLTLALLTSEIPWPDAIGAVTEALRRGVPEADLRTVAEEWLEPGRPGPGHLLEILDAIAAGTKRSA